MRTLATMVFRAMLTAFPISATQCNTPMTVDVGQANDRWFINAASLGFGATSRTPSRLNCLGSAKRLGLHRRPSWPSVTDRSGF